MVVAFGGAMRGRKILALIGLILAASLWAGDGGGAEAQKARAAALEALVAAKQASLQAVWKELAVLESEASRLREVGGTSPSDQSAVRVEELLARAEKRQALESRRVALLRQLKSGYVELEAAQSLLRESKGKLKEKHQILDGAWVITMMPTGLKGEILLEQTGTLVSGEYRYENGMTGNVQGTLISNQLVLERIDAQYGRIGRLEAQLAKDGTSLQGTWYSYELTSGKPLVGALTLERKVVDEDQEEEAP